MKAKLGTLCIALGLVLVALAAGLYGYNRWDASRAAKASDKVLDVLEQELDTPALPAAPAQAEPDPTEREMTTTVIDGYDYIGYLSIPSLGLALPVMEQWSYDGLKIAPGRYSGSLFTDDLVIAGHNYARHFSPIKRLPVGAEVQFTDMDGTVWEYTVSAVEVLQPVQVEEMTTKTDPDDWDLTLFTCTTGGQARCAVRCVHTQKS